MAILRRGNTIYVDESGEVTTENIRVAKIIFTPGSSGDTMTLSEVQDPATRKIKVKAATETIPLDFSADPIRFESGIFIYELSDGATATLVLSNKGASN